MYFKRATNIELTEEEKAKLRQERPKWRNIKNTYLIRMKRNGRSRVIIRLIDKEGTKCWLCGWEITFVSSHNIPDSVSLDHVIPCSVLGQKRNRRGPINNLKLSHILCNGLRKSKNPLEFEIEKAHNELQIFWKDGYKI